jgi:hypothetical protein
MFVAKLKSTYQVTIGNMAEDCNLNIHIHVQVIHYQLASDSKGALHHWNSEARNSICMCNSVDRCCNTVNKSCYWGITPCIACNAIRTVARVLVMCLKTQTHQQCISYMRLLFILEKYNVHLHTFILSRVGGSGWRIITGFGLDDLIYLHFFYT